MTIQEILTALETSDGHFPRAALMAARQEREAITPALLARLESAISEVESLAADDDTMGPIYAMFLLSEFREPRLYPLLVRFFSIPGEDAMEATGDVVTAYLHRMLASVWGDDDRPIRALAEDPRINEWVRGAAVRAMITLVARDLKPREEVVEYYRHLLAGPFIEPLTNFWNELVSCAADLYPEELMEEIGRAYEMGVVDPGFVAPEDLQRELDRGKEEVLKRLRQDSYHRLIDNTVSEMSDWYCFTEEFRRRRAAASAAEEEPTLQPESQVGTYRRTEAKVGRNDPCPCGSGQKFKKCCGK